MSGKYPDRSDRTDCLLLEHIEPAPTKFHEDVQPHAHRDTNRETGRVREAERQRERGQRKARFRTGRA